jgi:hypothetical protein
MGDLEKMQPRPFKRTFFQLLGVWRSCRRKNKDAAARRISLMSFKRHREIYPNNEAPTTRPTPQLTILMSFQLAIPWRVALQHCPPLLHQPKPILLQRSPNSGEYRGENK